MKGHNLFMFRYKFYVDNIFHKTEFTKMLQYPSQKLSISILLQLIFFVLTLNSEMCQHIYLLVGDESQKHLLISQNLFICSRLIICDIVLENHTYCMYYRCTQYSRISRKLISFEVRLYHPLDKKK